LLDPFNQKITIYSAKRGEGSSTISLKSFLTELPQAHELGIRLFKRNLKAQYRQSLLGITWALFPPLITAGLWIFLRANNVMRMDATVISYPVFVITGTMLWQVFSESIMSPIKNVSMNKSMLVKINIPREGLLLSGIYEVSFNILIKFFMLGIIYLFFQQVVSIQLLLVPIGIVVIMLTGFSIGLVLTPIGLLYTDISKGLGLVLPFLMYLTPVVYPQPTEGMAGMLMKINPMASLITVTRNWFTAQPVEQMGMFWIYTAFFLVVLFFGWIIYRLSMPIIIEKSGS